MSGPRAGAGGKLATPIPRGAVMPELAFEYALQCWNGVAEFRQAAGLDGQLPARDTHADDSADAATTPAP